MSDVERITVLLSKEQSVRLNQYCESYGFKKSTLIARLVKDHLDMSFSQAKKNFPLPHLEHQLK